MVKIGSRGTLDLALWVIAEQRYEAANYATTLVGTEGLVYDWDTQQSNYGEIFDRAIADAGGRAWVTEMADNLEGYWFGGASFGEFELIVGDNPYPYITRLRTSMLVDHIDEDLVLIPAEDSQSVSRDLLADRELNRPGEGGAVSCSYARDSIGGAGLALLAALALVRRRRRRSRINGFDC